MVDFDSAFLWESEALRSPTPRRARQTRRSHRDRSGDAAWVTLREGHERTGIPISTLRKWAMGGNVATYMEETPVGEMRMISLQGVYERAEKLGRQIRGAPPSAQETSPPKVKHRSQPARQPSEPDVPPGTTLVPLDAWNKMLLQLGNLHEAGQQLAEASARAAKAETEATFLKERLTEMREELARLRQAKQPTARPEATPEGEAARRSSPRTFGLIRQIYSAWRNRPST